jgi:F-box protein 8
LIWALVRFLLYSYSHRKGGRGRKHTHSLSLSVDTIFVVCYSLILLSVDLTSPHVKNKMSKREFIRNLRQATPDVSSELLGHMYDNIYLSGHVATEYS